MKGNSLALTASVPVVAHGELVKKLEATKAETYLALVIARGCRIPERRRQGNNADDPPTSQGGCRGSVHEFEDATNLGSSRR